MNDIFQKGDILSHSLHHGAWVAQVSRVYILLYTACQEPQTRKRSLYMCLRAIVFEGFELK